MVPVLRALVDQQSPVVGTGQLRSQLESESTLRECPGSGARCDGGSNVRSFWAGERVSGGGSIRLCTQM